MPRRKPVTKAPGDARHLIASTAARLMAEDGIGDYGLAKRKAAHQLGASTRDGLPANEEVERELRAYQSLYQADEQPERLHELRLVALEVMEQLAEFRPYLTGSVLDGTAGRYAVIELDVFADSSKDVEIMLLSNDIRYQLDEIQHHRNDSAETRLRLDWDGFSVNLMIYPPTAERSHPRNTHTGKNRPRAAISAVTALLAREANPP
jgi:hypothetical protein